MRSALSSRGAVLGDFGLGMGAALGGRPRRARIDTLGRNRWPSAGATLDLDFVNQQGYAYGQGLGRIRDLVTISGGAGGTVVDRTGAVVAASAPRFDFDPITLACKGLLIEEQRTNLLKFSDQTNVVPWSFGNTSGAATQNGNSYTFGANATDRIVQSAATVAAVDHTGQITLSGAGNVRLFVIDGAGGTGAAQAIALNPVPTTYVLSRAFAAGNFGGLGIYNNAAGTAGAAFTIHRAQLEAGSFATSYIPTAAAAVTRTADDAIIGTSKFRDLYNERAGTFVVEGGYTVAPVGTQSLGYFAVVDSPAVNDWRFLAVSPSGQLSFTNQESAPTIATAFTPGGTMSAGVVARMAAAYLDGGSALGVALCLQGGDVKTVAGLAASPSVQELRIGRFASNPGYLNGRLLRLRYWPRRLSNAELQDLTR